MSFTMCEFDSPLIWQLLDSSLCLFVFFPSMVLYWRGIWDLIGVYVLPGQEPLCHWVTVCIGSGTLFGYLALPFINHYVSRERRFVYILITRLYLVVYGALAMCYWRGVWSVADYYLLEHGWIASLVAFLICFTVLTLLRVSRTLVFPPFVVSLDAREDVLVACTVIGTQVDIACLKVRTLLLYAVDSALTQLVVLTLTIVTWRSAMNIVDCLLFPDRPLFADLLSAVIGGLGCILVFSMEGFLAKIGAALYNRKPVWWVWLMYEDAVYLLIFIVEVFTWRGIWNLTATYVISDPLIGGWVNHAIGLTLLLPLQLMSYAGFTGCGYDGREPVTSGYSMFSTKYLRHFFNAKITAKKYDLTKVKDGNDSGLASSSSFRSYSGHATELTPTSDVKVAPSTETESSNFNSSCSTGKSPSHKLEFSSAASSYDNVSVVSGDIGRHGVGFERVRRLRDDWTVDAEAGADDSGRFSSGLWCTTGSSSVLPRTDSSSVTNSRSSESEYCYM